MNVGVRRKRPFWHAPEARIARPELWLLAVVVVSMLLVEVWQSSRMAELCLTLDRTRHSLAQERSRLEFGTASLERGATRGQLDPLAASLGLMPTEANQVVDLPAGYLAEAPLASRNAGSASLAWLNRLSHALVPEAIARSRTGS